LLEAIMIASTAKRQVKRLLAKVGYQINPLSDYEVPAEHLTKVLTALAINCLFDVGAHKGDFGRTLRRIGYSGKIVSFEPVAANFKELAKTASNDPNWHVCPFALGDKTGKAEINVFHSSDFNSLLPPSQYGNQTFSDKMGSGHTETIDIKRLDEILPFYVKDIAAPRLFLKMDTQGYDMAVVEGAGTHLDRFLGLQTEVALKPIYEGMQTTMCSVILAMQGRGFEVTGLFPVSRDRQDELRLIELDCVMIRGSAVSARDRAK
jgi:FkbM family methyltransferase